MRAGTETCPTPGKDVLAMGGKSVKDAHLRRTDTNVGEALVASRRREGTSPSPTTLKFDDALIGGRDVKDTHLRRTESGG